MIGYVAALVSVALTAAPPADRNASDLPSEHWGAGADMGWMGSFDDTGLWSGGFAAGASGYWSANAAVLLGMRFGIDHWAYEPGDVVRDLVPAGADLVAEQSSGSVEMVEFAPFVRYWREGVVGPEIGGFVQGAVAIAYVDPSALTEVVFDAGGPRPETATFEIGESYWRPAVTVSAGLTRGFSEESWIEVFPSYRAVFETGTTRQLWSVSFGIRMRM